ncbi:unnamed protein product [Bursaphelenchus xylophilus]|uniref:(pine wood nematode) hypothetical protein n=1 Tax=Bursaphelenchus xylophilus TaxID=6326 RepID=A0A1I7S5R2_BURXY|nr:unnamed protein product [Bursaphelenchus xylophilus]CAG9124981.1 unnamed protein product [Bursaphelenchus xylophilus]
MDVNMFADLPLLEPTSLAALREFGNQLMLKGITHSAQCSSSDCPDTTCGISKDLIDHLGRCAEPPHSCCQCEQVVQAFNHHALHCRDRRCQIPPCREIRKWQRAMKKYMYQRVRTIINDSVTELRQHDDKMEYSAANSTSSEYSSASSSVFK